MHTTLTPGGILLAHFGEPKPVGQSAAWQWVPGDDCEETDLPCVECGRMLPRFQRDRVEWLPQPEGERRKFGYRCRTGEGCNRGRSIDALIIDEPFRRGEE